MTRLILIAVITAAFIKPVAAKMIAVTPAEAACGTTVTFDVKFEDCYYSSGSPFRIIAKIGFIEASSVQVIDQNHLRITFTLPDSLNACGFYFLDVSDDGEGRPLKVKINPRPGIPHIKSVSPSYFKEGASVRVMVSAVNTHFSSDSISIKFRDHFFENIKTNVVPLSVNVLSDTTLELSVNLLRTEMFYNLVIYSRNSGILQYSLAIITGAPSQALITSFSPAVSKIGDHTLLRLHTSNTVFTMGKHLEVKARNIYQSGNEGLIESDSCFVINDTLVEAYFNFTDTVGAGHYYLQVKNEYEYAISENTFIIYDRNNLVPEIVDFYPKTAFVNDTTDITITCRGVKLSPNVASISFISMNLRTAAIKVLNDTTIMASVIVPDLKYGQGNIKVISGKSAMASKQLLRLTNSDGFIPEPRSIYPASSNKEDSVLVRVKTSHTRYKDAATVIVVFDSKYNSTSTRVSANANILSDTLLECKVKFSEPGMYSVSIHADNEAMLFLDGAFTVLPGASDPQITKVKGNPVLHGSFNLEIECANISFPSGGAKNLNVILFKINEPELKAKVMVNGEKMLTAKFTADSTLNRVYGDYNVRVEYDAILLIKQNAVGFYPSGLPGIKSLTPNNINIYPLPIRRNFKIATAHHIDNIFVLNQLGAAFEIGHYTKNGNEYEIDINKYNVTPGVYFLRMVIDGSSVYKKLIIE